MVRIRSQLCIRIRNFSEDLSGSVWFGFTTLDWNPPGIHAHASEGQAADCSSCRRQRLLASCQTRSPAQHRTRASADQRRTCTKRRERKNYWKPMLRIRIRDPVPFLTPDPGSGMVENPDHTKSLETIFLVKILNYFHADPGPRWKKFGSGIREEKKFGSGINIPDSQHCSGSVFKTDPDSEALDQYDGLRIRIWIIMSIWILRFS